LAKIYLIFL